MPNQAAAAGYKPDDVHHKIGLLTRQLHDSLRELGYAEKLRGSVDALPDAQSRLSYIARLTGEAAEKVLGIVDTAKDEHAALTERTRQMRQELVADPVSAVAKGRVMNYLEDMEAQGQRTDSQLTEIMMAQDFHDLTGQVIAKVVSLAASLEEQLVGLLIQTAPPVLAAEAIEVAPAAPVQPPLSGPVVNPDAPDVVTSQSQVDDLLASLGF